MDAEPDGVPGLDLVRVRDHLAGHLPGGVAGPLTARLLAGGRSNLTYVVGDGVHEWVLRRPPLGHVLATAHDMAREHRVMTALRDTAVPVPRTYLLCEDPDVTGAPFYLMERVGGVPYRSASELAGLGEAGTRAVVERLVDTLADLHAVDPVEVGLADFGRPAGFLGRQVRRWTTQLAASRSRDVPDLDELAARLAADVPDDGAPAVVHGDYRLDNVLVLDGRVSAVLDWEMATLGDALTDVALLLVYRRMATLDAGVVVADSLAAPGALTEAEILERYAAARGAVPDRMGFHLGLAYLKLAVILEGIHFRYLQGKTVGEGFGSVGSLVEPLAAQGLSAMEEHD